CSFVCAATLLVFLAAATGTWVVTSDSRRGIRWRLRFVGEPVAVGPKRAEQADAADGVIDPFFVRTAEHPVHCYGLADAVAFQKRSDFLHDAWKVAHVADLTHPPVQIIRLVIAR